ncbi:MAG TPA: DIP1984 family protein [Pyrinomonadaceae bacterium]|nr:DIP1984 family protein [Pyrinomonadaceae bacterium]
MKLAEALILRADCQKRIAQLKARLLTNAKIQEGDAPAETPQELIAELGRVSAELLDLIKRVNKTNSVTTLDGGKATLSDALAERDVLGVQRAAYVELAQTASITQDRYSRSEVKYVSTINVAEIQKRADELAKNYRELDTRIQELNWKTELVN